MNLKPDQYSGISLTSPLSSQRWAVVSPFPSQTVTKGRRRSGKPGLLTPYQGSLKVSIMAVPDLGCSSLPKHGEAFWGPRVQISDCIILEPAGVSCMMGAGEDGMNAFTQRKERAGPLMALRWCTWPPVNGLGTSQWEDQPIGAACALRLPRVLWLLFSWFLP